jgi:predicted nucleotidyltransferase
MPTFDVSTNPDRVPFSEVLLALAELARAKAVSILLVGATARDIALAAEGHTAPLRATSDVDIAVAIADSATFDALVADLEPARRDSPHKFLVEDIEVDIVPFGGVERADRTIEWPDGSIMNTLGFFEAMGSALKLVLAPEVTIAVASLAAQTALKIFAWADRGHWTERDAVDLRTLLFAYSEGVRLDNVYAESRLAMLESYDYDVRRAGAHWLGVDIRCDLGGEVAQRCVRLVVDDQDRGRLPAAMRGDFALNRLLLEALQAGLLSDGDNAPR